MPSKGSPSSSLSTVSSEFSSYPNVRRTVHIYVRKHHPDTLHSAIRRLGRPRLIFSLNVLRWCCGLGRSPSCLVHLPTPTPVESQYHRLHEDGLADEGEVIQRDGVEIETGVGLNPATGQKEAYEEI